MSGLFILSKLKYKYKYKYKHKYKYKYKYKYKHKHKDKDKDKDLCHTLRRRSVSYIVTNVICFLYPKSKIKETHKLIAVYQHFESEKYHLREICGMSVL